VDFFPRHYLASVLGEQLEQAGGLGLESYE
jgi:hypothetical protein